MNTITIFFLVANWIVAICSLCALKQTRAFKREEKYSKRAFIAPCPDPVKKIVKNQGVRFQYQLGIFYQSRLDTGAEY